MLQQRRKKGFTLAELLIVVAVIAVLVAIAVPIFVTATNNAKEGVFNANLRSLKGLAVAQILGQKAMYDKDTDGDGIWKATGSWNDKGELTLLTIENGTGTDKDTEYSSTFKTGDVVTVVITQATVNKAAGGTAGE